MFKMKTVFLAILLLVSLFGMAQIDSTELKIQQIESSLVYQKGEINFETCKAKLSVPSGFRYLDAKQSKFVLSDLWGNPVDSTILGLLVPEDRGVLAQNSWAFTINFEDIGYVKDNDAESIDYDELLKNLQKETKEANPSRVNRGYQPINLVGWASKPYYDKEKKVLHWAKELKFGSDSVSILNYNLRILGKEGVFVLNAVATMNVLADVRPTIDKVLSSITFEKGSSYFDFDPKVDKVAAWTIGGLVAGKVLAKVGFFALFAKFFKIIAIAVVGAATAIWRFIRGKNAKPAEKKPLEIEESNQA